VKVAAMHWMGRLLFALYLSVEMLRDAFDDVASRAATH
jgi:hypothetical protein